MRRKCYEADPKISKLIQKNHKPGHANVPKLLRADREGAGGGWSTKRTFSPGVNNVTKEAGWRPEHSALGRRGNFRERAHGRPRFGGHLLV